MPELSRNNRERIVPVKKTRDQAWITREFSASVFLFWIKGQVSVDYRSVRIIEKNTVLGLFPAGEQRQNIPLGNISSATISTAYKPSRFLWGSLLTLGGVGSLFGSFIFGLLLAALGIVLLLSGVLTQLIIEKSGSAYVLSVPFFNKQDILDVQQVIDQALDTEADKHDLTYLYNRLPKDH